MNQSDDIIDLTATDADPAKSLSSAPDSIVVDQIANKGVGEALLPDAIGSDPGGGDLIGGLPLTAPDAGNPDIVKRSIVVAGHKTSVSLEDAFWHALKDIARERSQSLRSLVAEIDAGRKGGNLSSAVRLHVLDHYRRRAGAALSVKT